MENLVEQGDEPISHSDSFVLTTHARMRAISRSRLTDDQVEEILEKLDARQFVVVGREHNADKVLINMRGRRPVYVVVNMNIDPYICVTIYDA